jgi:hypothetical protein
MRNIGSSVFASSSPQILRPVSFRDGELVVVPDDAADTHHLDFRKGATTKRLASHPNGWSCHNLGQRIISGGKVTEQAEYIVRCGGTADFDAINSLIS